MNYETHYDFNLLFARIRWMQPETIRHYVSDGKFSFVREYDENGKPMFDKIAVEKWIKDHRPRRPRTKKRVSK